MSNLSPNLVLTIGNDNLILDHYTYRLEIVQDTAAQVIKDFGMYGFEFSFSGDINNAYNELFEQAFSVIQKLYIDGSQKLYNIFYTVDLNPNIITDIVQNSQYPLHELTREVLIRELKKVVIRYYFKHKNTLK